MSGRSGRRTIGLLTLLAAVVMLGAATADWARIVVEEPFGDEGVIRSVEPVAGPDQAGWLIAAAFVCMVLAGLVIRWSRIGVALAVAGGASAIGVVTSWPGSGETTAAPGVALAAALAVAALGAVALVRADRLSDDEPRPAIASRYTVEAAAGRADAAPSGATEELDEWDAAVAEGET